MKHGKTYYLNFVIVIKDVQKKKNLIKMLILECGYMTKRKK